ncbi:MAG TPA: DegT/DnrJ/EryC1/StrS family aminotransferase, partial [bacterium]|nr:DegT/DnrJ/EryC1/StrS family aminotransferase [bacterium]
RAIVPVHLMGKPAEMDTILSLAEKHHLMVVEDAAEAHGAVYRGRNVGSIGTLGAFSLYVAHIVSTVEGGIVTTDKPEMAEILRSLRAHVRACKCSICTINTRDGYCPSRFREGRDIRFIFERVGFSSKMNELEAAIGLGNLAHFEENLDRRRKNFALLAECLKEFSDYFFFLQEAGHERIGPHAFPIILRPETGFTRDELIVYLARQGIDSRDLFSSIPTECSGYRFLGYQPGAFPVAEYISAHGLHVGVHQDIGKEEIEYLAETVRQFLQKKGLR